MGLFMEFFKKEMGGLGSREKRVNDLSPGWRAFSKGQRITEIGDGGYAALPCDAQPCAVSLEIPSAQNMGMVWKKIQRGRWPVVELVPVRRKDQIKGGMGFIGKKNQAHGCISFVF
jgi:hypothetical protein